MNLIQQSVQQITKENLKNYYDTEQAEDELFNMLQSNRLYMMKDRTLDFIKQISGKSGDSYNIRETGKFLSDLINLITFSIMLNFKIFLVFYLAYKDCVYLTNPSRFVI
jgi:hypothetical protein